MNAKSSMYEPNTDLSDSGGFSETDHEQSSGIKCTEWELQETTYPRGRQMALNESMFSIGNGFIGVRGYPEEAECPALSYYNNNYRLGRHGNNKHDRNVHGPLSNGRDDFVRGTYINGFYEQNIPSSRPYHLSFASNASREFFLVRAPDAFCIDTYISGIHLGCESGVILSHQRSLDLRTGELRRRTVWGLHQSKRDVTIESFRFVSACQKNIAAVRYIVTAKNMSNTDIRIVSRTTLPRGAESNELFDTENIVTRYANRVAASAVSIRTRNTCKHLVVATSEVCTSSLLKDNNAKNHGMPLVDGNFLPNVAATTAAATDAQNFRGENHPPNHASFFTDYISPKVTETDVGTETVFAACVTGHVQIELTKFIAFLSDEDATREDLCDAGFHHAAAATQQTYEGLFESHCCVMEKFWSTADVKFRTKDASDQGAFRFNLLQLFMASSLSPYRGFPSRGLSGELLGGLHRWDVEAFVIPYFSHVCPEKARSLLNFRIHALSQARENAAELQLSRGAVYPQLTMNGGDSPSLYCPIGLFANGIIAYALQYYVAATNDFSILFEGGAEMLFSSALVWIEWGTWDKGVFHIRAVTSPDQFSGLSDDNLFTNLMAQHHMHWASYLAIYIKEKKPEAWESLKESCRITDADIIALENAANNIEIIFDHTKRIHPIDQSFLNRKKWSFEDLKFYSGNSLIRSFHPNVIYRHQVCRISDVLLSLMLLPEKFNKEEALANFNFYEPITTRGTSLSLFILGAVSSQLRIPNHTSDYFHKLLFLDIEDHIVDRGRELHSSTAVASWWALVMGYGGMRLLKGVLHFDPVIPADWNEYQFNIRCHGCLIQVFVDKENVAYTLLETPPNVDEIALVHSSNTRISLSLGSQRVIRQSHDVQALEFNCVVFELETLIEHIDSYHYESWLRALEDFIKEIDESISFCLTPELYRSYLKHSKPILGLSALLSKHGINTVQIGKSSNLMEEKTLHGLYNRKLHYFRTIVHSRGISLKEGTLRFISKLRRRGITLGCVTLSKNGRWILNEASALVSAFDYFIDAQEGEKLGIHGWPDADHLAHCAKALNTQLWRTVVVMDGIDGFSKSSLEKFSLIIDMGMTPEPSALYIPRITAKNFSEIHFSMLEEIRSRDKSLHRKHRHDPANESSLQDDSTSDGFAACNSRAEYPNAPPR